MPAPTTLPPPPPSPLCSAAIASSHPSETSPNLANGLVNSCPGQKLSGSSMDNSNRKPGIINDAQHLTSTATTATTSEQCLKEIELSKY